MLLAIGASNRSASFADDWVVASNYLSWSPLLKNHITQTLATTTTTTTGIPVVNVVLIEGRSLRVNEEGRVQESNRELRGLALSFRFITLMNYSLGAVSLRVMHIKKLLTFDKFFQSSRAFNSRRNAELVSGGRGSSSSSASSCREFSFQESFGIQQRGVIPFVLVREWDWLWFFGLWLSAWGRDYYGGPVDGMQAWINQVRVGIRKGNLCWIKWDFAGLLKQTRGNDWIITEIDNLRRIWVNWEFE